MVIFFVAIYPNILFSWLLLFEFAHYRFWQYLCCCQLLSPFISVPTQQHPPISSLSHYLAPARPVIVEISLLQKNTVKPTCWSHNSQPTSSAIRIKSVGHHYDLCFCHYGQTEQEGKTEKNKETGQTQIFCQMCRFYTSVLRAGRHPLIWRCDLLTVKTLLRWEELWGGGGEGLGGQWRKRKAAAERSLTARQTAAAPLLQHGRFFLFPPGGVASAAPVSGRSRALLTGMLFYRHPPANPHSPLAELTKGEKKENSNMLMDDRWGLACRHTNWHILVTSVAAFPWPLEWCKI